jgi:hypothetical protein
MEALPRWCRGVVEEVEEADETTGFNHLLLQLKCG